MFNIEEYLSDLAATTCLAVQGRARMLYCARTGLYTVEGYRVSIADGEHDAIDTKSSAEAYLFLSKWA